MSVTRPSESGQLPYVATEEPWVAPEIDGSVHRRSFARRKPLAVVGVTILGIYAVVAILGPLFVVDPLTTNPSEALLPPSADHLFGTDKFGRDVFARAVHAARHDLSIGVIIAISSVSCVSCFVSRW